jgi:hypothetical protein
MAPREPDTRTDLRRALALNALTKPLNVLVPAVVVVAASLLGAAWLVAVAGVCWLALAAVTFFDEDEAARVGARRRAGGRPVRAAAQADPAALSPPIRSRLEAALAAQGAIRAAVVESELPLGDVVEEIDTLVTALEAQALRAQRIDEFLAHRSPESLRRRIAEERSPPVAAALDAQLQALTRLRQRHADLLAEMDHVVASLETVHAEVLAVEGVDDVIERRAVASQVLQLRTNVQLVSEGLEEAFEETRARVAADLGP